MRARPPGQKVPDGSRNRTEWTGSFTRR